MGRVLKFAVIGLSGFLLACSSAERPSRVHPHSIQSQPSQQNAAHRQELLQSILDAERIRIERCFSEECEKLDSFGPNLSRPQKLRPWERCFEDSCDELQDYGPNSFFEEQRRRKKEGR